MKVIERCIPIRYVRSIDEVSCPLDSRQGIARIAMELAHTIKREFAYQFGEYLRCSTGIASNELLAKIAVDCRKPDRLYLLEPGSMREYLMQLELRGIPGIGERMEIRLLKQGIRTVQALLTLTPSKCVLSGSLRENGPDIGCTDTILSCHRQRNSR